MATEAQLDHAKADFQRAREVLLGYLRETELEAKRTLVGRCFKHIEHGGGDHGDQTWPVYLAAVSLDADANRLEGFHFQLVAASGQMEIAPEPDLQAGFLTDSCIEVTRGEFITAFNELLTTIAHFATRLGG